MVSDLKAVCVQCWWFVTYWKVTQSNLEQYKKLPVQQSSITWSIDGLLTGWFHDVVNQSSGYRGRM